MKARRLRGQVYLRRADLESARSEILTAIDLAKEVGNPPQLWKTYVAEGDLMKIFNEPSPAKVAYSNAIRTIENVAEKLHSSKLKKSLLNSDYVKGLREKYHNLA